MVASCADAVLRICDSPPARADLARRRARLTTRLGGLGLSHYLPRFAAHYASGFLGAWPERRASALVLRDTPLDYIILDYIRVCI